MSVEVFAAVRICCPPIHFVSSEMGVEELRGGGIRVEVSTRNDHSCFIYRNEAFYIQFIAAEPAVGHGDVVDVSLFIVSTVCSAFDVSCGKKCDGKSSTTQIAPLGLLLSKKYPSQENLFISLLGQHCSF